MVRLTADKLAEWTRNWFSYCTVEHLKDAKEYSWALKGLVTDSLAQGATSILDLGCGGGVQIANLKNAVGLDVDLLSLRSARRLSQNDLVLGHASWLPFGNNSFDLVNMREVIEHLSDQRGTLEEVARVLSPSGRLVIQTPNRYVTLGIFIHKRHGHVHEFTPEELRNLLLDLGFQILFQFGSTIPYIPSTSRFQRLNSNTAFFALWKFLDRVLPLSWDIIMVATKQARLAAEIRREIVSTKSTNLTEAIKRCIAGIHHQIVSSERLGPCTHRPIHS